MKKCARCQKITKNFGKEKRNKDGLKSFCRPCLNKAEVEKKRTHKGFSYKLYHNQVRKGKRNKGMFGQPGNTNSKWEY